MVMVNEEENSNTTTQSKVEPGTAEHRFSGQFLSASDENGVLSLAFVAFDAEVNYIRNDGTVGHYARRADAFTVHLDADDTLTPENTNRLIGWVDNATEVTVSVLRNPVGEAVHTIIKDQAGNEVSGGYPST